MNIEVCYEWRAMKILIHIFHSTLEGLYTMNGVSTVNNVV